jgi:hypothetical protein
MVKFLSNLPQVFKERYLNTHETYLKSIADLIWYLYKGKNLQDKASAMVVCLTGANKMKKRIDTEDETVHFRNLRNSWYHECVLNYPDALDERMRFAAWKIIQCYYAIFSSIASLVCCYHTEKKSHDKVLNIYAKEFLCNSKKRDYFLPPTNFYLNQQGKFPKRVASSLQWEYAHSYYIPNIIKCLEEAHLENRTTTVPHYLKKLRDWVTYGDAYLFIRLYGKSPKINLDFSLQNISFMHCLQAEFYLLRLFGWEAVNRQFEAFSKDLEKNLNVISEPLVARFKVYSSIRNKI